MNRKFLLKVTIFVTLIVAIGVNIYTRRVSPTAIGGKSELESIEPQGDFFKEKEAPFLHYEVYKNDRLIGYCFYTKDVAPEVKGYASYIEMLVSIDTSGNIKKVKVLRHNEAGQYAGSIVEAEFLGQFIGKGPGDSFTVGRDIDGVTHATISSRALAESLKVGSAKMHEAIYGVKEKKEEKGRFINLGFDFYATVLIVTFLLIVFFLKNNVLRYIGLFISIVYFGFLKANFISMSNLGSIFLWNIPALRPNAHWYIFIFSGLILTFLFGSFYCSYMCPFGALQIFLNRIFKFNIMITPHLVAKLRKIRYILLWILIVLVLVLNNQNIVNYEPFSTVFLIRGSLIAWAIAVMILGLSLIHYRPFCNYFCSAGAFLEILSNCGRRVFGKR